MMGMDDFYARTNNNKNEIKEKEKELKTAFEPKAYVRASK